MHHWLVITSFSVSLGWCLALSTSVAAQSTDPIPSKPPGLAAPNPFPAKAYNPPRIHTLIWLEGAWISDVDGNIVEELWMRPRGGMMLGLNRTISKRGKSAFEFMRIAEAEDGLVFYASPSGKPATPFAAIEADDQHVVFENRKNDFPQRILYQREKDALLATIEGEIDGKKQSMSWKWIRDTKE